MNDEDNTKPLDDKNTLNPLDSELDAGLDDSAFQRYDADEDTLPGDGINDDTETGLDDVDGRGLEQKNKIAGDIGSTLGDEVDDDMDETEE